MSLSQLGTLAAVAVPVVVSLSTPEKAHPAPMASHPHPPTMRTTKIATPAAVPILAVVATRKAATGGKVGGSVPPNSGELM